MTVIRWRRERNEPDESSPSIEGEAGHVWWSERDELTKRPSPKKRGSAARTAAAPTVSGFVRYNSAESLFGSNRSSTGAMSPEEAFSVIGVTPSAERHEILLAYRAQAKQHHPDSATADEATMVRLNQAYATLRRLGVV